MDNRYSLGGVDVGKKRKYLCHLWQIKAGGEHQVLDLEMVSIAFDQDRAILL